MHAFLYDSLCLADGNSNGSPLAPDANGDLTYVLVSPTLNVAGVAEGCATVEARAKPNGNVFARVGKGFLAPATGNSNFGAPHDIFNGCWHDK